ncbi:MAG: peptide chain release factor N(5)-glutamine methyltransferase [Moraxella sp.]|nr:peptide chain release factor N(5)-glutamine methyltransferase [Moraxella sp.]
MTIKEIRHYFKSIIHEHLPYHWLEEYLLFVIKKDKVFLITHDDYELSNAEYQALSDGITKMQNGTPLAYLLGEQEFWGRTFKVNHHTLIPRADTEKLIEVVLGFVQDNHTTKGRILDLGTGTGCIAITLAKELPNFDVLAVDYSCGAVSIANDNIKALQVDNCQVLHSDWFHNVQGVFDIVVSNPPYIDENDEHLVNLVAEPITALTAKDNGLADIKHIIKNAKEFLANDGLLAIEHGYKQAKEIQAMFHSHHFKNIRTIKDYGNNDRITLGQK